VDVSSALVLVRHAEPVRWARGRAIGRTDVGLSRAGTRQAVELARQVGQADRVVSSPAARALQTARPIADASAVPVEVEDDLREIDFGAFDGRTFASIRREHPGLYRTWMHDPTAVHFPGGERWGSFRARALDAIDRVDREREARRTVVVTHLGVILAVIGRARSLADDELFGLSIGHATANVLETRLAGPVPGSAVE